MSILLVSDDADLLADLQGMLEPLDERTVGASGKDAIHQLLEGEFAAVLIDVEMEDSTAFQVVESVRSNPQLAEIPVIFLGNSGSDERLIRRGYELGAVDFLEQPLRPFVLRSKMAILVGLHRKRERLKAQERQLREAEKRELELRHRAEIRESELRIAQLVESAMDAIITVSESGIVDSFNQSAQRMFGRIAAEVTGGPASVLFPDELEWESLQHSSGIRPGMTLLTGRRASGEQFPAEVSVTRMEVDGKQVLSLILRDVSEQRRAEAALRTQAALLATTTAKLMSLNAELHRRQAELQHAMNARNRFYASMSHELRTPINAIIGYGTLLVDDIYGPLNERQRQGLIRSNRAALHLLELVNDVLDLSRVEAGRIELSLQPVSFPGLLDDIFVTVRTMADIDESLLSLEPYCRVTVVTDPRRVRQILLNLISNAIRFGDGLPIVVSCRTHGVGGVEISVTDHGPGIAEEDVVRIFDEFVQLEGIRTPGQPEQGTGLGLAISRRLAELLGGTLEVESVVGEGSVFRLCLPASAESSTS